MSHDVSVEWRETAAELERRYRAERDVERLRALWSVDYVASSNVVDGHVRNLHAKLLHDSHPV